MSLKINVQLDYTFDLPCDVLLQIEAAAMDGQIVSDAHFSADPSDHVTRVPAQDDIGTRIWLRTRGRMVAQYQATVNITRKTDDLSALPAVALHELPGAAVPYLMPSLYCPSNQFTDFTEQTFGAREGGAKVVAIRDWIAGHLSYAPGSSHSGTTAVDTFHDRKGICRDYAHLMITLARAAEIPARVASVYGIRVKPQDFHAVAEVYLGGAWHLVDPTGMGTAEDMAIIGIGRDIGDVAFLTAFGPLVMNSQSVSVTRA